MGFTAPEVTEGRAPFKIPGIEKECETWYKIVGDLERSEFVPLVVVHGGPGLTHDYLESMGHLTELYGIPVVLYEYVSNLRSLILHPFFQ